MAYGDDESTLDIDPSKIFLESLARTKGIPLDERDLVINAMTAAVTETQKEAPTRHRVQSPIPEEDVAAATCSQHDILTLERQLDDSSASEMNEVIEAAERKIPASIMPYVPTLKQYCDNYAEGVASAVSGCNSYLSSGFSNVGPLTSRMKNIALGAAFGWTSIVGGIYLIRLIRGYFSPEEDDSFYSHSPEVAAYHLKREAKKAYKRGPREATY